MAFNGLSNELREMNDKILNKKCEIRKLANENKLDEAKKEKEKLIEMGKAFDVLYDLEEGKFEEESKKILNKVQNGGMKKYGQRLIDNNENELKVINKGQSFRDETIAEKEDLSLGKYIKGMLTGDWNNATNEMEKFKALSTKTGGVLVPSDLAAQVIDLARPMMALGNIPIIPMETNNLSIAKIVNDPEVNFKEELAKSPFSEMTFGTVELKSRTIYGLMKISLEMMDSAFDVDKMITNAMAKAIAQGIDKYGLYGDGVIEPKGLLTYDDINIIEADPIEQSKYSSFVKGIGEITKANGVPTTLAFNSEIDTDINLLTDTSGQPLNMPKRVGELEEIVSNNIKPNQAMLYDRNAVAMGLQRRITITSSNTDGFVDGSVTLRIYAYVDFAILQPKHVTRIDYKEPVATK